MIAYQVFYKLVLLGVLCVVALFYRIACFKLLITKFNIFNQNHKNVWTILRNQLINQLNFWKQILINDLFEL